MYSAKVRQLLAELPGRGDLEAPTHRGRALNPVCGDQVEFDFTVDDGRITASAFRAEGCPAALASAAAVRLLALGRTLQAAGELTSQDIIGFLQGLPAHKRHGAEVALQALRNALESGRS